MCREFFNGLNFIEVSKSCELILSFKIITQNLKDFVDPKMSHFG